ncbi:MAG: cyclic lactone autoinducer peptide [Peptostreptococcaceae bacterium]
MKKIALKLLKNMSALSFGIALLSTNSASAWFVHQPEEPKELNRFKKIK